RVRELEVAEPAVIAIHPQRALDVGERPVPHGSEPETHQAARRLRFETMGTQEGIGQQHTRVRTVVRPAFLRDNDVALGLELRRGRALERYLLIADLTPGGIGTLALAAGRQLPLNMQDRVPVTRFPRRPGDGGERFPHLFPQRRDRGSRVDVALALARDDELFERHWNG